MQVKVCPKCETLVDVDRDKCSNECGYVFNGSEEGAKGKVADIALKSCVQGGDFVARHLSSADASGPSGGGVEATKSLLINLGAGLAVAAAGAFLFAFASSAAHPNRPVSTTILNTLGPWIGGVLVLGAIGYTLYRIVQVLRGPRLQEPADTVETFFSNGVLDSPRNFWFAWSGLTPQAREDFGSLAEFKQYWKKATDNLARYLPASLSVPCTMTDWRVENTFTVKDMKVTKDGRIARARFTICIVQKREYNRQTTSLVSDPTYVIEYGTLNLDTDRQLVQGNGGHWLLIDGRIELPQLDYPTPHSTA